MFHVFLVFLAFLLYALFRREPMEQTEQRWLKVQLPVELAKRVKMAAMEGEVSMKDWVARALLEKLNGSAKPPKVVRAEDVPVRSPQPKPTPFIDEAPTSKPRSFADWKPAPGLSKAEQAGRKK
jgi:hypothetical protein